MLKLATLMLLVAGTISQSHAQTAAVGMKMSRNLSLFQRPLGRVEILLRQEQQEWLRLDSAKGVNQCVRYFQSILPKKRTQNTERNLQDQNPSYFNSNLRIPNFDNLLSSVPAAPQPSVRFKTTFFPIVKSVRQR